MRIYPTVWIAIITLLLPIMSFTASLSGKDLFQIIGYFFYTPFWFLQALMVYYFFGYFLFRIGSPKLLIFPAVLTALAYVLTYILVIDLSEFSLENPPINLVFYFGIFIFGIFIGHINNKITYAGLQDFVAVGFFLIGIYVHKLLMSMGLYSEFQAIQHICMFPLLFFLLKIARAPFVNSIMQTFIISDIIFWISAATLEIYIVHRILGRLKIYELFTFPVNLLIFVTSTFMICWIILSIQRGLRRYTTIESTVRYN